MWNSRDLAWVYQSCTLNMLDSADVFLARKGGKRTSPLVVHVLNAMYVMPRVELRRRPG